MANNKLIIYVIYVSIVSNNKMSAKCSPYKSFYQFHPLTIDKHRIPIIIHKFTLKSSTKDELRGMRPDFGFGNFGETVYYRTYSRRIKELTDIGINRKKELEFEFKGRYLNLIHQKFDESADKTDSHNAIFKVEKEFDEYILSKLIKDTDYIERQEHWVDTIIRAIEGCFSYYKNHMIKNGLAWNDDDYQDFARDMAISAFKMEWLPPGRGLWASGTEYTYERGSACLNNCGMTCLRDLANSVVWAFDMLMCGCGIGFKLDFNGIIMRPDKISGEKYVIADNREGWAESAGLIIRAYVPDKDGLLGKFPTFDYSLIRGKGEKLKGFGGESSGPGPLIKFHKRLEVYFDAYLDYQESKTKEEKLNCFANMAIKLRGDDFGWMDDDTFNDLLRHLRGEKVIQSIHDLLCHLRWVLYSHLDEDKYKSLINGIRETNNLNLLRENLSSPDNDKITQGYKNDIYLFPFKPFIDALVGENFSIPDVELIYERCESNAFAQLQIAADKRILDLTYLMANIVNATGACVVAGNVRRSSEILGFDPTNQTGLNLKDDMIYPERVPISWMSNNSAIFSKTEDFRLIPEITKRVVKKGEPGFFNLLNVDRYGRIGRWHSTDDEWTREYEKDAAEFTNPCGEIPLCDKELCNLSELIPIRCRNSDGSFDEDKFNRATEYATFYASSVSLVPSHWASTNEIIARNRRIGVSITGGADLYDEIGFTEMTRVLRKGYRIVRETNRKFAKRTGVPESIRVTTVKPSGTVSQLAGVSSGMHFPIFRYSIRRMRSADNAEVTNLLRDSGYSCEKDFYSDNTVVFSFPINQGKTRKAADVTIWEKLRILETFQREWADNSVSNTIDFDPDTEANQLEAALAQSAPMIKSCSFLPRIGKGAYKQMTYEEITESEFEELSKNINIIDWSTFGIKSRSDGECPKFCTNDSCTI